MVQLILQALYCSWCLTTKITTPLHGPISYNSYSNNKFSCYKYALVLFNYFDILGDVITFDDKIVDSTNQSYEIVRNKRACGRNDLEPLFASSEIDASAISKCFV